MESIHVKKENILFTTLSLNVSNLTNGLLETNQIIKNILKKYSIDERNVISIHTFGSFLKSNISIDITYAKVDLSFLSSDSSPNEQIYKLLTSEPLNFSIKDIVCDFLYPDDKSTPIWKVEIVNPHFCYDKTFSSRYREIELSNQLTRLLQFNVDIYFVKI